MVWWREGSWEFSHACGDMLTASKSSKMRPNQYFILAVSVAWYWLCQHCPESLYFLLISWAWLLSLPVDSISYTYSSSKFTFCWSYLKSPSVTLENKNKNRHTENEPWLKQTHRCWKWTFFILYSRKIRLCAIYLVIPLFSIHTDLHYSHILRTIILHQFCRWW